MVIRVFKKFLLVCTLLVAMCSIARASPVSQDAQLQFECENAFIEYVAINQNVAKAEMDKLNFSEKKEKEIFDNGWFWLFVLGQLVNGANMNYAQSIGYYEKQDWWLGRHPSVARVWATKIFETIVVYKIADNNKKYQDPLLILCNAVVWYFVQDDFKDPRLSWKFKFF